MFKNRWVRIGLVAVVAVGVLTLALMTPLGAAQAQGGPNGRGPGGPGGPANGGNGFGGYGPGAGVPLAANGELTEAATQALAAGIQDEYNAYAVYQAVIDQFGPVAPFVRIQAAEAQHIAALERAFTRYGLPVPEAQPLTEIPQFDTLADACAAGIQAETMNFALYDQWIAQVQEYPDLVRVFTALRNASQNNHLPAFELCAG